MAYLLPCLSFLCYLLFDFLVCLVVLIVKH